MKTNINKSELESRSEQLSTRQLPKINFARRHVNRSLDRETLLAVLRGNAPQFFELAEVVGKWIWIQFSEKQPREVTSHLAELGFHWNHTRQAWQHPCGLYRNQRATFDPRKVYCSYFAADLKLV
jgi:hypothetical protein